MASAQPWGLADLLVTRFNSLSPLNEQERSVLRLIERKPRRQHKPDTTLLAENAEIRAPQFILSGWAARVRELKDRRCQIINVLLPGDAIGLAMQAPALSPTSVVALTPLHTVEAPEISPAWRDKDRAPGLSRALDLAHAEEDFFLIGQVARLGRQTAYERIAHWFLELEYRLSSRGLSTNGAFPFPLKQETIADVVGLSVVHVNRTLKQMRQDGRIDITRGRLALSNMDALTAASEFRPPTLSEAYGVNRLVAPRPPGVHPQGAADLA
jgi:CRP-like cAMP-binding protein